VGSRCSVCLTVCGALFCWAPGAASYTRQLSSFAQACKAGAVNAIPFSLLAVSRTLCDLFLHFAEPLLELFVLEGGVEAVVPLLTLTDTSQHNRYGCVCMCSRAHS
jgi:hypothetical protein